MGWGSSFLDGIVNFFKPVTEAVSSVGSSIASAFDFDDSPIPSSPSGYNGMANVGSPDSWGDALGTAGSYAGGLLKNHGAAILGGAAQGGLGYLAVQEQGKMNRQSQERQFEMESQRIQEQKDWLEKERERIKNEYWDYHNKKGFFNAASAPSDAMFKGKRGLLGRGY